VKTFPFKSKNVPRQVKAFPFQSKYIFHVEWKLSRSRANIYSTSSESFPVPEQICSTSSGSFPVPEQICSTSSESFPVPEQIYIPRRVKAFLFQSKYVVRRVNCESFPVPKQKQYPGVKALPYQNECVSFLVIGIAKM